MLLPPPHALCRDEWASLRRARTSACGCETLQDFSGSSQPGCPLSLINEEWAREDVEEGEGKQQWVEKVVSRSREGRGGRYYLLPGSIKGTDKILCADASARPIATHSSKLTAHPDSHLMSTASLQRDE